MVESTINLIKAKKYLSIVKSNIKDRSTYGIITCPTRNFANTPEAIEKLEGILNSKVEDKLAEFNNQIELHEFSLNLKDAIFAANIQSGISALLTAKEIVIKKTALLTRLLDKDDDVDFTYGNIDRTQLASILEAKTDYYGTSVTVSVMPSANVKQTLKSLAQELNRLDDAISELNVSTKIKVSFSENIAELLGLPAYV